MKKNSNRPNFFSFFRSSFPKLFPFLVVLSSLFLLAISILNPGLLFDKDAVKEVDQSQIILIVISGLSLIVSGIIPTLTKFLDNDSSTKSKKLYSADDVRSLISKIRTREERSKNPQSNIEIEERLKQYIEKNLTIEEIEETLYKKTSENLEQDLLKKLHKEFKAGFEKSELHTKLNSILEPLEYQIEDYITKLQRNSIVNLIIGIVGTMIAVTILSFSLINSRDFPDFGKFSMHFLPRFVFVISVQIFAFFFLRLYKNNLDDAKYFQNELTNLLCKTSALKVAHMLSNSTDITNVIEKLSTVERNFKLQKDESLLYIEKAKIERDVDLELLKSFK